MATHSHYVGEFPIGSPQRELHIYDNAKRLKVSELHQLEILFPDVHIEPRQSRSVALAKITNAGLNPPAWLQLENIAIDDTPIRTREYWRQQNPAYEKYIRDARYQTEKKKEDNDPANVLQGKNPKWKEKLNALDPWNPNAPIPGWVRFGKRDTQGFNCFVTDWNEGQWVVNKNSGYSEKIGRLTVDHTVARANLGLTTDANTKMVWGKANNKKGMKFVTYEELRNHLHSIYEPITLAPEVLDALNLLRERKVKVKL